MKNQQGGMREDKASSRSSGTKKAAGKSSSKVLTGPVGKASGKAGTMGSNKGRGGSSK
jgi:hypothetical protein